MKVAVMFVAIRLEEAGEPVEGQTKEDFLQCLQESIIEDPFSFLDTKDIQVACTVKEVS